MFTEVLVFRYYIFCIAMKGELRCKNDLFAEKRDVRKVPVSIPV